jgi:transposase
MKRKPAAPVFKAYEMDQMYLLPRSLEELIPAGHVVRVVNEAIEQIDLRPLLAKYKGGGTSSYHPGMMLKVLVYAYTQRIYSSRQIAKAMRENVTFMWLSGGNQPDFRTINGFRGSRMKGVMEEVFAAVLGYLMESGHVKLEHYFVDGTKVEADANAHKVVWAKRLAKNRGQMQEKIRALLEEIERVNEAENAAYGDKDLEELGESGAEMNAEQLKEKIAELNRRLQEQPGDKPVQQGVKKLEEAYLPRQERYEAQEQILAGRRSYAKTDEDASCMRMKEDRAAERPLPRPGYNVQMGTEDQFIVGFSIHQQAGDTTCLVPHLEGLKTMLTAIAQANQEVTDQRAEPETRPLPATIIADAGYGSEENYAYLEDNQVLGYVKYNTFHRDQIKHRKPELIEQAKFRSENFPYDAEKDEFICPAQHRLTHRYTTRKTTANDYQTERRIYECAECAGCPLKAQCTQAQGNRRLQFSFRLQRFREQARLNLLSPEGKALRARRSTEVETVFGHIKHNMRFRRFSLRGLEKVKTEWALICIAHNMQKLAAA